jgi:hydroxymethylpyrimidine pyrophosphatase-like HAD family hydrolase
MMPLTTQDRERLRKFVAARNFTHGMLVLDLDGTALLEDRGKVFISSSVEKGLRAIHDLGGTVVVNTLRFPLSVIRTIGEAWYQIVNAPILTVLLNGSVLGYIKSKSGALIYEEIAAFPMTGEDLQIILDGVRQLMTAGIDEILLFYYTRDWQRGETLWTPDQNRVPALQAKYVSASRVLSGGPDRLEEWLCEGEICMASLFIDRPEDTLMAYQHGKRNSFFTRKGIDKASGLREIAKRFDLSLPDSVGAGDTEMDTFLSEVGFAITVGRATLPYCGLIDTMHVSSPAELGEAIMHFADLLPEKGRR